MPFIYFQILIAISSNRNRQFISMISILDLDQNAFFVATTWSQNLAYINGTRNGLPGSNRAKTTISRHPLFSMDLQTENLQARDIYKWQSTV
jgi:hypothetical protein